MEEKRDLDEASQLSQFIPLTEASNKTGDIPEALVCSEDGGLNKSKLAPSFFSLMIIIPLVFSIIHGFKYLKEHQKDQTAEAQILGQVEGSEIFNENDPVGAVLGESDASDGQEKSSAMLSSENFSIQGLSLGGDVVLANQEEIAPLEISDIRSESFVSGKKEEVRLVVSWRTNKMAVSSLEYSKNSGQGTRMISEESYGFNHSAVVSGLEPRSSYIYSLKCRDRSGNEAGSDYFGIYTASKPVSVFDMISKALGDVFGWALGK